MNFLDYLTGAFAGLFAISLVLVKLPPLQTELIWFAIFGFAMMVVCAFFVIRREVNGGEMWGK